MNNQILYKFPLINCVDILPGPAKEVAESIKTPVKIITIKHPFIQRLLTV